jgi:glycine/D-amino acid oxidase-like deaminating enzyme
VERFNREGLANLAHAFPAFAGATILQHWAGLIDVTPDAVPVIGPVASIPGFYVASGFSGHGFGIGPGAGRLMAELVTGEIPCVDPHPFRLDRFNKRAHVARAASASKSASSPDRLTSRVPRSSSSSMVS